MDSRGLLVLLPCLALGSGLSMANTDHGFRVQQNISLGRAVDKNDNTLLNEQLSDKPTPEHFIEDAKNKVVVAVLVSLGVVVLLAVFLVLCICVKRKRACFAEKRAEANDPEALDKIPLQSQNG